MLHQKSLNNHVHLTAAPLAMGGRAEPTQRTNNRVFITVFRVLVFGPDGTFGDIGTDEKSFQLPVGIAVDGNGNIYVSDAGLSQVLKFAPVK